MDIRDKSRIKSLLDQMTLEEKVSLLAGEDFWTTVAVPRLGIPKVKVSDGPNGARGGGSLADGVKAACFPAGIAIGATWNPALVQEMGVALAQEAKTKGARVLLAPTVNIDRSGLNGRNFECYSEDPTLSAALSVAYVTGVQSEGVAATIKHFVGNESEFERQTMSSDIDERSLREIYLPPFEAAVKEAGVWAVMSSYNRLNGTYASENPWLLTTVLRAEWSFDGIVMSDWFGSHSTAATVEAGLDLEMPGPTRHRGEKLVAAVREGAVALETIDHSTGRILTLIDRVGAFDDPTIPEERALDRVEHQALIRRLGAEAAVLLKNDGILPLHKDSIGRLAVLGPNAAVARIMGGGSAQINAHRKVSPLDGLREALETDAMILYGAGCGNDRLTRALSSPMTVDFFAGPDCRGDLLARRTSESSDFFWFDLPREVDPRDFSVAITAPFTPDEDGEYRFGLTNAGFAKLYVDGKLLVDGETDWTRGENFFGMGNNERRMTMPLVANEAREVRVEYRSRQIEGDELDVSAVRFGVEKVLGDAELEAAVQLASDADVALVFVGRNGDWDTEGLDLPDMRLPGRQDELVSRVAAVNPRTVVVLQTGGPIEMPWFGDVAAVLEAWYPGQEAGHAIADVLFGLAEPGGRLAQTFPKTMGDGATFTGDPLTYPGANGHVRYDEGIYVGYRHFDKRAVEPALPFGFGLSYTSFSWSEPHLSDPTLKDGRLSIEIDVINTGVRPGSDVVQLYVSPRDPKVDRPTKELRAFAKLHLAPAEKATAKMALRQRDFAYFDVEAKTFRADAGAYDLLIARDAATVVSRATVVLEDDWVERLQTQA
ncbi:glycoside hydrolase family 3 C-terminal domain-containing protein [Consotaella aegiceratis]|uniref:glycoside hydrolase family 3 C-terminal domain-containing protein n=1 Tax=Consotaella aegiceratis TaxID=3097961 RepID=UPI002F414521